MNLRLSHLPIHAVALAALVICHLPHRARALSVIPPTFDELIAEAGHVVVAEVVASQPEWRTNQAQRAIFTSVRFRVEDTLKGAALPEITVGFLGGTIGDETLHVAGMPRFSPHERVILFLSSNRTEICPLIGAYHGRFEILKDAVTGAETVARHDGSIVRYSEAPDLASPKNAAAPVRPLTAQEFKQRIRDRLANSAPTNP
jgi:hypothetical protein